MNTRARLLAAAAATSLALAACGGSATAEGVGVQLSAPAQVQEVIQEAPDGLVVLDIRTPGEFATGHLQDATMIDFYEPDFADRLEGLPRDVPYVMYCNSGNRSRQAAGLMRDLGFEEVYEIDGGIQAWLQSGLPVTAG